MGRICSAGFGQSSETLLENPLHNTKDRPVFCLAFLDPAPRPISSEVLVSRRLKSTLSIGTDSRPANSSASRPGRRHRDNLIARHVSLLSCGIFCPPSDTTGLSFCSPLFVPLPPLARSTFSLAAHPLERQEHPHPLQGPPSDRPSPQLAFSRSLPDRTRRPAWVSPPRSRSATPSSPDSPLLAEMGS